MADIKIDLKNIRFLKHQASTIYLPFFESLLRTIKEDPSRAKLLNDVLKDVDRLIMVTEGILSKGVTIATAKDAQTINMLVDRIESKKTEILQYIIEDELEQARQSLDIDQEDVTLAADFASSKKAQKDTRRRAEKEEGPLTSKGIEKAFTRSTTKSFFKGLAVRYGWGVKRDLGALAAPLTGLYMKPAMGALSLGLGIGGTGYGLYRGAKWLKNKISPSTRITDSPGFSRRGSEGVGTLLGESPISGQGESLTWFFDKGWKKAKWTKDMYRFTRKIAGVKKKDGGKSRLFGGFFEGVGSAGLLAFGKGLGSALKMVSIYGGIAVASGAAIHFGIKDFKLTKDIIGLFKENRKGREQAAKPIKILEEKVAASEIITSKMATEIDFDPKSARKSILQGDMDYSDLSPEQYKIYERYLKERKAEIQIRLNKARSMGLFGEEGFRRTSIITKEKKLLKDIETEEKRAKKAHTPLTPSFINEVAASVVAESRKNQDSMPSRDLLLKELKGIKRNTEKKQIVIPPNPYYDPFHDYQKMKGPDQ